MPTQPTTAPPETPPDAYCCRPPNGPMLNEAQVEEVTDALEVLAHPIRFRLLAALVQDGQPACVCDLEALVPVKQPTVSHHLKLLRSVGLVDSTRQGHWMYYHARQEALEALRERILTGLDAIAPTGSTTNEPTETRP